MLHDDLYMQTGAFCANDETWFYLLSKKSEHQEVILIMTAAFIFYMKV
jgi:hypothetical protein